MASVFIGRLQRKTGKKITGLASETMERFMSYPFPGNVRELKSTLEYAFVVAESGLIEPKHLPLQVNGAETVMRPTLCGRSMGSRPRKKR